MVDAREIIAHIALQGAELFTESGNIQKRHAAYRSNLLYAIESAHSALNLPTAQGELTEMASFHLLTNDRCCRCWHGQVHITQQSLLPRVEIASSRCLVCASWLAVYED